MRSLPSLSAIPFFKGVPKLCQSRFSNDNMFERYHRRHDELDRAIGEMFVKGISIAKVGEVIEKGPSVSRALSSMQGKGDDSQ